MSRVAIGKRIEFYIFGLMLKDGLNVYVPLADDHGVDALIAREDGSIARIQIKGCSAAAADPGSFAATYHGAERPDFWFVFHSERLEKTWMMTSAEFLAVSSQNKTGKWIGERSISFLRMEERRSTCTPKVRRIRGDRLQPSEVQCPSTAFEH